MGTIPFSELKRRLAAAIADVQAADQALAMACAHLEGMAEPEEESSERAEDLLRQAAAVRTIEREARASAVAAHQITEHWRKRQAELEALLEDLDPTPRTS